MRMEVGSVKKLFVEVMGPGEALGRFAKSWKGAATRGGGAATIGLGSMAELSALLSPRRMELIRHVARHPGLSIRALAGALGRDYKNVHTDVTELEARHVLERSKDGTLISPYDEIVIRAPLRDAA
jgi:predicted transcriptional regulator